MTTVNLSPDIGWFVHLMNEEGVCLIGESRRILSALPDNADIQQVAQEMLNQLCANRSEDEVQTILGQIQELAGRAMNCAASGAPVPTIAGEADFSSLPDFSQLPQLSEVQAGEFMKILLGKLREIGCSDLHLCGGAAPFVRYRLQEERVSDYVLTDEDSRKLNFALLSEEQRNEFTREQDLNFAFALGADRFRVCLMDTKDGVTGSYRLVPDKITTLEALGFLPEDAVYVRRLLDYNNGLILVTGPIGSGKTTTLAAMTDIVNEKRYDHIISIEDPIEIVQESKNCQVTQRQVGLHTPSYRRALKAALREDPDVIIIGEMHDLETIENAITASETGHLVIGTLHTSDAANTMNRLLDVFPPSQQPQIRAMTSVSLRGVVCQKLIPDGFGGVVLIYEILLNSMAVGNLISEGKSFQLKSTMAVSHKQGMCTFDQCIFEKFSRGLISRDAAVAYMTDPTVIDQLNHLWVQNETKKRK